MQDLTSVARQGPNLKCLYGVSGAVPGNKVPRTIVKRCHPCLGISTPNIELVHMIHLQSSELGAGTAKQLDKVSLTFLRLGPTPNGGFT